MMDDLEGRLRAPGAPRGAAERATRDLAARAEARGLLDVAYAVTDSPVGDLLLAQTPRGLVRLAYLDPESEDRVLDDLAARVSPRVLRAPAALDDVRRELDRYFAGGLRTFSVPIDWRLTRGFTRRVLERTAAIDYGATSTYREVAAGAGSPAGFRAAGNALGANPIPIVVPCHRVLRSGGDLGGYGGGVHRKELLLRLEGVAPR
jgi:methylated-DNA-[protein]-cysteine S-methyltransferase